MKENFINYITYTRQYSPSTIRGYSIALRKLDEYLTTIGKSVDDPENIKLIDIYNFTGDLSKSGLSARTCAWIIDLVRGYLKFCKNIAELDIIDIHRIKTPKIPDREIGFFSEEDKEQILDAVNRGVGVKDITKLRNKLLTYMLLHTGLRCHEIAKIKVNEIGESLQVIGKGGIRRFVYLRPELLELINLYLVKREKKSDYLFPSGLKDGGHITTDRIRKIFNMLSKKLGIHVHAHKFRHTFACDLLHIPGSNIYSVSKLLGHKRITTTQIYLGTDSKELKNLQFGLNFF